MYTTKSPPYLGSAILAIADSDFASSVCNYIPNFAMQKTLIFHKSVKPAFLRYFFLCLELYVCMMNGCNGGKHGPYN